MRIVSEPGISVVIPLYNKGKEVLRALDSIFAQTRIPDEVIVVDDGSTDGSASIVKQRFDGQVVLIRQANAGVAAARNRGIEAASNEFICLLDADDEWMPEHIQEITALITDYPETVFYSTRIFFQDEWGKTIRSAVACSPNYKGLVNDFADVFSRGYGLVHSSSVCIRKSIYFQQGLIFPSGEKKGEDLYYWIRLGMIGPLAFSDRPLVKVYLDAQNRSVNLRGQLPYHISWYLANQAMIANHPQSRSIKRFIHKNSVVTAYSLAQLGDRQSVKMIVRSYKKNKNSLLLVLLPALILPSALLNLGKIIRRRLRVALSAER